MRGESVQMEENRMDKVQGWGKGLVLSSYEVEVERI